MNHRTAILHEVPEELRRELDAAREALRGRRRPLVANYGIYGGANAHFTRHRELEKRRNAALVAVLQRLRRKLEDRILIATGRFGSASARPRVIPPSAWKCIRLGNLEKSIGEERPTGTVIFDIRVSRLPEESVTNGSETSAAVQQVTATTKTEADLIRVLVRLMLEFPTQPCLTKRQCEGPVNRKWGIGPKGLNRCWGAAADKANTPAWKATGRRKGSALEALPDWAKLELGFK